MTIPVRQGRRAERRRRFDLRSTAMFFLLLAIIWCVLAFLARTAAVMVERRPVWAGVLAVLGLAGALRFRSGWRRFSAGRYARRAARALEEAADEASEHLGATATEEPAAPAGTGAPAEPTAETVILEEPAAPLLAADYAELDPDGFEYAIAELCARGGCRDVEVVGGAGDLGADVVAIAPDGRRVVIQCKQYGDGNKVGSQDVQRFGGTCFTIHEADVAAVVTTSDFTAPALEYARQCGIVCLNGDELEAWRRGTGGSPWQPADTGP
ncbi:MULTISPECIES: restriction endonuclease [Streptomyces]|uniref:Restriction endonuclease n=3 Tax=Streptomyces TaxID=1883 RepID=A0ABS9JN71_9ACTN|nr:MULTISPECIES: restriction endonuclease [Streptomyces]MCG0067015.1 restriction endonuclease [Streptomyces tricolor]OYP13924.1 restriction endonuclease [Streptomyces sp. FBKL.4005]BCM71090.1 putative Mrr restriction system protein [Streptomyces sp. EAS-AB2608]